MDRWLSKYFSSLNSSMCIYGGWPIFLEDSLWHLSLPHIPLSPGLLKWQASALALRSSKRGLKLLLYNLNYLSTNDNEPVKLRQLQMSVTYFVCYTWGFWGPFFGLLGLLQPYSPTTPLLLLRKTKLKVSSPSPGHCASKQKAIISPQFENSGLWCYLICYNNQK